MNIGQSVDTTYSSAYYKKYEHYVSREDLRDIPLFAKVLDWVCEAKSKRVLEIGCGLGYLGDEIIQRSGSEVIGLELSSDALERGMILYPDSKNVQGDALNIPLVTGSMDCVLVINVIEHLAEREQRLLVSEVSRVLKLGGMLVISTPEVRSIYAQIMIHDPSHR